MKISRLAVESHLEGTVSQIFFIKALVFIL